MTSMKDFLEQQRKWQEQLESPMRMIKQMQPMFETSAMKQIQDQFSQMQKLLQGINIPKFDIPKVNIPAFNIPKFEIPDSALKAMQITAFPDQMIKDITNLSGSMKDVFSQHTELSRQLSRAFDTTRLNSGLESIRKHLDMQSSMLGALAAQAGSISIPLDDATEMDQEEVNIGEILLGMQEQLNEFRNAIIDTPNESHMIKWWMENFLFPLLFTLIPIIFSSPQVNIENLNININQVIVDHGHGDHQPDQKQDLEVKPDNDLSGGEKI